MSEGRIVLQEKDCGEYVFWARPCVRISDESVTALAERAAREGLDFAGMVYGKAGGADDALYSDVLNLSMEPSYTSIIRNVGAGVYRKEFLKEYGIAIRDNPDTIFPDLDVLWRTFIYAVKARFTDSSVCEEVQLDTVWINDTAAAFDVNRRYDYIRSILMEDWNRWRKWSPYFCLQRYRCYFEILHWMKEDVAWEFAERMVVDIHRSRELEEMDDALFTPEERTALHIADFDPGFLKRYFLGKVIYVNKIIDTEKSLSGETERRKRLDEDIKNIQGQLAGERTRNAELEEQCVQLEENQARLEEERARLEEQMDCQRLDYESKLEQQMQKYETSTTFRVGKVIMFIPVTLKKTLKKLLGRTS